MSGFSDQHLNRVGHPSKFSDPGWNRTSDTWRFLSSIRISFPLLYLLSYRSHFYMAEDKGVEPLNDCSRRFSRPLTYQLVVILYF